MEFGRFFEDDDIGEIYNIINVSILNFPILMLRFHVWKGMRGKKYYDGWFSILGFTFSFDNRNK